MSKYDHIDFTPPQDVQDAAQQGLDYRDEYGRGGTDTGIARARDLSNGRNMSPETIGRMVSFFARHESNRDSEAREPDGGPTNGWIAWLLWGGDAGKRWAEKVMSQMEAADKQNGERQLAEGDRRAPIKLFSYGRVEHKNGAFVVDSEFAASIVDHARHMREMGYYIPILRQHQEDGHVYGLLVDVWADGEGVWALPEFAAGYGDAYDAGLLRYWSPTFADDWECPHTGRVFARALREVSMVSVPHQKNIGGASAHYSLSENGYATHRHMEDQMADQNEATKPNVGEEAESTGLTALAEDESGYSMGDIQSMLGELKSLMAAVKSLMEDDEDEAPMMEEGEEETEMAELRAVVTTLQEENARLDISRRLGEVQGEQVKHLVALRRTSPALYEHTVTQLAEARKATTLAASAAKTTSLSEEIGSVGQQSTDGGTLRSLCEEAKAEGVPRGTALLKYLDAKGIPVGSPLYDIQVVSEVYGSRG